MILKKKMTEHEKQERDWVEYVRSRVNSDIEINKNSSGVDFSHFLAQVLGIYSALSLDPDFRPENREKIVKLGIFGLGNVARKLENKLGKPVYFYGTVKAGLGIWNSYKDRAEEIDEYIREMYDREVSQEEREINDKSLIALALER
jgi:hypothetical protein